VWVRPAPPRDGPPRGLEGHAEERYRPRLTALRRDTPGTEPDGDAAGVGINVDLVQRRKLAGAEPCADRKGNEVGFVVAKRAPRCIDKGDLLRRVEEGPRRAGSSLLRQLYADARIRLRTTVPHG
jgi:hypothetical protein